MAAPAAYAEPSASYSDRHAQRAGVKPRSKKKGAGCCGCCGANKIMDMIDDVFEPEAPAPAPQPAPAPMPPPPSHGGFPVPMVAGQIIQIADGRFFVAVYDDALASLKWTPCAIVAPPKPSKKWK